MQIAAVLLALLLVLGMPLLVVVPVVLVFIVGLRIVLSYDDRLPVVLWRALRQRAVYTSEYRKVYRGELKK